ncbi:hypothetical protein [Clostridium omnivorum]|uniref:Uncharacterized protein n=1 Tax=Clostridium omnivorum TaxID=1604902 RepID=A0ABQ5N361_9CLOT|nr:hypothetical protein [Clostridium sp. E14]GLC29652.1 hypothetical protein bsdE14_10620 [Clostridium sp. E14]
MGKQIRFFQMYNDEVEFVKVIEQSGDYMVTSKGERLLFKDVVNSNDYQVYIALNNENIYLKSNGYLDTEKSDVIEYSRCEKSKKNELYYGRLWAEFKYYVNEEIITKNKYFQDKYKYYAGWIKRSMHLSKCKKFYIADEALKLYRESEWDMMATPVTKVDF